MKKQRIIIAPNTFKHSISARQAAIAIREGLEQSKLDCDTVLFPVADGGDGTAELLIAYLHATIITKKATDPLGRQINTYYGLKGDTAILELAAVSGLQLLNPGEYDPLRATSYGTGELIADAVANGARKIILCIGGSATVDGALGILRALGVQFTDGEGDEIIYPYQMVSLADYSIRADSPLTQLEIRILCDVRNRLLGEQGAAAVFGPQKGASQDDVVELEKALTQLRNIVLMKSSKDINAVTHGGASGGVAAGMYGIANASLMNGIDYFLEISGFARELAGALCVITGEGSIDEQTLEGKAPFGVAMNARKYGVPVIALGGVVPEKPIEALQSCFYEIISINPPGIDKQQAIISAKNNLIATAKHIGDLIAEGRLLQ